VDQAPLNVSPVNRASGARTRVAATLGRAAGLAPERIRRSLLVSSILRAPWVFRLGSWMRFLQIERFGRRLAWRTDLLPLKVRGWGGEAIYVRPRGTDWETAHASLIGKYHRPPTDFEPVRTILDLGANIGATVADMAVHYPGARILGVELDADNVAVARRNTAPWADRARILHGAAWTIDGEIAYGGDRGEYAYRVQPAMDERSATSIIDSVPAYSLSTLIDRLAPGGSVDYVKMDIEGAESFILDDGDQWAGRVRCIKVEIHLPLDVGGCSAKLQRLGFTTVPDPAGIPSVTGYGAGA
jgi:FkbM family methyltransferase